MYGLVWTPTPKVLPLFAFGSARTTPVGYGPTLGKFA
jgi:hypothetical protein